MKAIIILLTLVFFSTHSQAESAVVACDMLTFSSDKKKCYKQLGKSYISPNAIATCKKTSFGSDQIKCLFNSKDKEISAQEAQICAKESFGSDLATCMKNAGTSRLAKTPVYREHRKTPPAYLSDTERFNRIRKLARTVSAQINNREYTSAKANLSLIQDLTEGRSERAQVPQIPQKVNIPGWAKKLNKIQIPN